ncbi:MAG: hypothetical protein H8E24_00030 [Verrucomicrobia bacterium]|nr:hypothetical protein [Verrucomicrobiota bacterium]
MSEASIHYLKNEALKQQDSMSGVLEQAIILMQSIEIKPANTIKVKPPASGRGGVYSGIDLDDNAALEDAMRGL